ncbi:hypothetical protein BDP27DRAFT_1328128 [Rhodocollybia butyracea]|uniref:trans-L-3-hydroxyproline dehydratase n=1 Tax=Rhodocollybia butyracea TaxID=206335 RepID=A0A9P5PRF9_9AGAR|nr:hypothetical protein BDP27DRAFT_1328128 [Rhodocollybia butyracea]
MDVFRSLEALASTIKTLEMHTSGEPTRIIIAGYPTLEGNTLLEKRRYASETPEIDEIRKRLMHEPRGHEGMYGAILVPETELTLSGQADIGVLFCHNEGYSTMCGHATIALGRFLVDTHDIDVFPMRQTLHNRKHDEGFSTEIRLHAPCGVVYVTVPTTAAGLSDPTKPVQFRSVPSFVSSPKHGVTVDIPSHMIWPKLAEKQAAKITVDIAYGGAFYALVSAEELGRTYPPSVILNEDPEARRSLIHPNELDMGFLYGVTIIDTSPRPVQDEKTETWLCFFADEQIDRSPTGSCVSAHVPLAVQQGRLQMGEWCSYDSFLSTQYPGNAFRGRAVERTEKGYIVEVEGYAHYTGASSFVASEKVVDRMGEGFELKIPLL